MTKYFSPGTGGFYESEIHGDQIPFDAVGIDDDLYRSVLYAQADGKRIDAGNDGYPVLVDINSQITQEQFVKKCINLVQALLDSEARKNGYDSILSACSYVSSSVAKFKTEALAFIAWRDAVWSTCYSILDQVESGARIPPSLDQLIGEMPLISWSE